LIPVVFNGVEPEPSMETAEKCSRIARENSCHLIIGLGGGSAMDVAKKVATDLVLPKIMIPTTAGTGSEVTHESVLKVEGEKRAFVDERLTADVAIVDPSLMVTMPTRLIASSGIDALAHAIESYQCKKSNELTRSLARRAYLLIKDNIRKAVTHDENAISSMALASLMAGMAFGNSGTTLCHALTYPLSKKGIPHGEAVAIMLPPALEFNNFDKEVILEIKKIIKDVGLPTRFKGDVHEMAAVVIRDKRHLSNNPKRVTFEDIVSIYRKVVEDAWK
jgi:alcohol dehydrogenase class IV